MGADSPRETLTSTNGARQPATVYSISRAYSSPWLEVALNTRTPVAAAAPAAVIMECSDSSVTRRPGIWPPSIQSAKDSMISVWGVMGKAGT